MKKRIALLLLTGACLMNTVPCFASQSVKVSYVGSQGTEYAALPSSETLQKDVGFKPKAPAALTGGYCLTAEGLRNHLTWTRAALRSTSKKASASTM